jgi:phosphohistidine phosphatase
MSPANATTIEYYLVRHAVAADRGPEFPDDAARPLTADGVERFRKAVAGLRALDVVLDLVITSPYARAQETAELLCAGLKPKPKLVPADVLAPGHKPAQVITAVEHHMAAGKRWSRVALVGHEPDLGELAARLLGARGTIAFKKGAVCRIDVDRALPGGPGTLRWFLTPSVLRDLAP